jgi:hypothetical protein
MAAKEVGSVPRRVKNAARDRYFGGCGQIEPWDRKEVEPLMGVDGHPRPVHLVLSTALPRSPARDRFRRASRMEIHRSTSAGAEFPDQELRDISGNVGLARGRSRMSAGVAGNWWAIGLRSAAAILSQSPFYRCHHRLSHRSCCCSRPTSPRTAHFAILAGMRGARSGYRWPMLILEGSVNLTAAAAVLAWAGGRRRSTGSDSLRLGDDCGRGAARGSTPTFPERGSLNPCGGRSRVGRLGCLGGDPRRQRHADNGTVAGRLCADLWRDPRGARRPLATRDNASRLGAPPAARGGVNRSELCPAPASRMSKLDPMLRGWHGRCVRRPCCDTICGPPGR